MLLSLMNRNGVDSLLSSRCSHRALSISLPPSQDQLKGDSGVFRESIFGVESEMTYGGALSFLRRKYSRDLSAPGLDLVVSGVPFDNAVTYRPGARLGPRGIRAASVQPAELKPFPWGVDPFDDFGVIDFGDCYLNPHRPETIFPLILPH